MQAMARAQAEGGGAPGSPGKAPQQQGYPFEVLRIWRSKVTLWAGLGRGRGCGSALRSRRSPSPPLADQPTDRSLPAAPPPQMQDDLRAADAKGPGQRYRLRLLVQQGKDVEQAGEKMSCCRSGAVAAAVAALPR